DVALMRATLHRFDFVAENVRVLTSTGGETAEDMATRANIFSALGELAKSAQPGSHVVVFMAGHGSRQPATTATEVFEPDGLDEIFLPADVRDWDGSIGTVENAITDDELGTAIAAIRRRG